jgi:hypothetical protein
VKKLSKILRGAKAQLTAKTWRQGDEAFDNDCFCATTAMAHIGKFGDSIAKLDKSSERRHVHLLFMEANGIDASPAIEPALCIERWNDAPERTLEEVHRGFDRAIALAESRGQ